MSIIFWLVVGGALGALITLWAKKFSATRRRIATENLEVMQKMVDAALVEINAHMNPLFESSSQFVASRTSVDPNSGYDFLMLCHAYAHGWLERYFDAELWHLRSTKYAEAGIAERLVRVASSTWANTVSGAEIAQFTGKEPEWFAAGRLLIENDPLFSEARRRGYESERDEFWNVTMASYRAGESLLPMAKS